VCCYLVFVSCNVLNIGLCVSVFVIHLQNIGLCIFVFVSSIFRISLLIYSCSPVAAPNYIHFATSRTHPVANYIHTAIIREEPVPTTSACNKQCSCCSELHPRCKKQHRTCPKLHTLCNKQSAFMKLSLLLYVLVHCHLPFSFSLSLNVKSHKGLASSFLALISLQAENVLFSFVGYVTTLSISRYQSRIVGWPKKHIMQSNGEQRWFWLNGGAILESAWSKLRKFQSG
jgi:hypothetical protein